MSACDMCDGTGQMMVYVESDGSPAMCSSAMTHEQFVVLEAMPTALVTCRTCGGSGVLPDYLRPEFWQEKMAAMDAGEAKPWYKRLFT